MQVSRNVQSRTAISSNQNEININKYPFNRKHLLIYIGRFGVTSQSCISVN